MQIGTLLGIIIGLCLSCVLRWGIINLLRYRRAKKLGISLTDVWVEHKNYLSSIFKVGWVNKYLNSKLRFVLFLIVFVLALLICIGLVVAFYWLSQSEAGVLLKERV